MKKLFLILIALAGFNLSSYAAFFCSKCDAEMEAGEGHECEDCGEYVCDDCWCDACNMWCKPCHESNDAWCPSCGLCLIEYGELCEVCGEIACLDCGVECHECGHTVCAGCMCDECEYSCTECHDNNGEWCPVCGECMIVESNSSETECQQCGTWYCKNCMCPECESFCLECMESENYYCKDCGSCAVDADDDPEPCHSCGGTVCIDCKTMCNGCGEYFCADDMCGDCMEYCLECSVYCEDCGGCCGNGSEAHQCPQCDRIFCEGCIGACSECGEEYCNDCLSDACDDDCGICLDCHESYEAFCEECGDCLFIKERCSDHEYACAECHEEFHCPDCGQCYADEEELCESCGLCADCAMSNEMHCPDCEACYEDVGRCEDDGDHCRECCENNDWLCEFCSRCIEAMGISRCDECNACEECVEENHLHCANCSVCMYDQYPNNSDRPEYCDDCRPNEEGIPCLVCGERILENGCTISGDGWHCDIHCQACPFCNEVCFAENPDDACPDCGACSSCVDEHNLHCANCGTCMYADYPNDNSRPEICDECVAAEGTPCNVCGQYITENGCTVSDEGWHCANHCQACPECNDVCFAENPSVRCPLCGRCSDCCTGHEDVEATIIADDYDDEDLQEFLAGIEPIQDGVIYEGELGDSLDLTNYHGSDVSWIPTLFPNLKQFRCTSAAQLNALTDEQRANLEALYCSNIGLTVLDLSKYPNLKTLDCSGNKITSFGSSKGSDSSQLESLNCSNNKLTALNASNWPNLKTLNCSNNRLATLNLSNCTELENLYCNNNLLTALNLSNCTKLEELNCGNNQFATLYVRGFANLKSLNCRRTSASYTAITMLNVSGCTNLEMLDCYNNQLTALNLSECTSLTTLYCSANSQLETLNLSNCSGLTNFDCAGCSKLSTLTLNGCTNLTKLNCYNCYQLKELNLDGCENLTTLNCYSCKLNDLTLSGCNSLESINCRSNQLTELNLDDCTNLTTLTCDRNKFGTLDLSKYTQLEYLNCEYNQLTTLTLGNNTNLTKIICNDNQLTALNLTGLTNLTLLYCYSNNIESLNLSNCTKLVTLYCQENNLETVNLSGCTQLKNFYCGSSEEEQITTLDLSGCANLTSLGCRSPLTELDLSGCSNLTSLALENIQCELNLSDVPKLTQIELYNYQFTELDLSNLPQLSYIALYNSDELETLDLSNCPNLSEFYTEGLNNIASVTAANNPELEDFYIEWSDNLLMVDLDGCSELKYYSVSAENPYTLNIDGCGNLESFSSSEVEGGFASLQLGKCKELNNVSISVREMPCTFSFGNLLGMSDAKVTNVRGAAKSGSNYITSTTTSEISFNYNGSTSYISFNGIKHIGGSNYSYSDYTAATDNANGSYTQTFTCACGKNVTETVSYKQEGVFLDVRGYTGDMTWVQNYTDLKGYRCDKMAHLNALTDQQMKQLTELYCANAELTGLIYLGGCPNLQIADFSGNSLTSLNVNFNTQLRKLNCSGNKLTALSLSNNMQLESLDCSNNQITQLDVSNHTKLKSLNCSFNKDVNNHNRWALNDLNLDGCTALEEFYCKSSQISYGDMCFSDLDLSRFANLRHFEGNVCFLNLNGCTKLRYVKAGGLSVELPNTTTIDTLILNGHLCLDLSGIGTPEVVEIEMFSADAMYVPCAFSDFSQFNWEETIYMTHLSNMDMSKIYNTDGFSYNAHDGVWKPNDLSQEYFSSGMSYYYDNGNPNIENGQVYFDSYHIKHDFENSYSGKKSYVEEIYYGYNNANFKNGYITCKYKCDRCKHSCEEDQSFSVGTYRGKEYNNGIFLDVTGWTERDITRKADWLNGIKNIITGIKFDSKSATIWSYLNKNILREIHCPYLGKDKLTAQYYCTYSNYPNLEVLDISGNNYTYDYHSDGNYYVMDFSNSPKLRVLKFGGMENTNRKIKLNVSNNPNLEVLDCSGTSLVDLNVSNNPNLKELHCSYTDSRLYGDKVLSALNVSANPKLEILDCGSNQLTELDLSNKTELRILKCEYTKISELDLSNCHKLVELNCNNANWLYGTTLDLSNNHFVKSVSCREIGFAEVNFSGTSRLEYLDFESNEDIELIELDLSASKCLKEVDISACGIKTLKLNPDCNSLITFDCSINELTELDLSKHTNLTKLYCGNNKLTTLKLPEGGAKLTRLTCYYNQITDLDLSKFKGSCSIYKNQLLYSNLSKVKKESSWDKYDNQARHFDEIPCTFRFADLAEGMKDANVYNYSGIEPVTVGTKQMWHVTATNGTITYYYNNGNDEIANVQHTITFDELEHTYITSGSQRYYTDSVPATYDAAGSCVAHYPCRYCDEELTEEIVIDKLLYKVAVKEARLEGSQVELGFDDEFAPLSTFDDYNAKGSSVTLKLEKNTELQLRAIAPEHYQFARWSDGVTSSQRTVVVTSDTTLLPIFELENHTISGVAQNGTVEGTGTFSYGAKTSVKAVAAKYYHFVGWSDSNTDNPRKIVVNGDATYTAVFEPNAYTIRVAAENGTIIGAGEVAFGSTVTLTATANEGYHFAGWSDGNTDNPRTVVIDAAALALINNPFTAIFEKNSENGGENQGGNGNQGGENGGNNQGGENGGNNQGGENQGGNNGGENNNPGTDVDETIAQTVKVYATGLTIHVENAVGEILLFDANGRAISRTTAADGEPVELHAPQMGVYIVRTTAGGVKVICNNY